MARSLWWRDCAPLIVCGEEDPLGAELLVDHFNEKTFSLERLPVRIVGVVDNVRSASLAAEGRETVYVPYVFSSFLPLTYVVRTAADPASLVARIRAEAAAMDKDGERNGARPKGRASEASQGVRGKRPETAGGSEG
jgi:hypothetical protein